MEAETSSQVPPSERALPRRDVMELLDLTFAASIRRMGAVALAALPVWVLATLPWAGATWIGLRWMDTFWEQIGSLDRFAALGGEDIESLALQIEQLAPTGPLAAVSRVLNGVYLLVSAVGGPLLLGALSCIIAGYILGVRVGTRAGWQGAARRGLELVFTEIVKAILFWLIAFFSILLAIVVVLIGSFALGALLGGSDSPLGVVAQIFNVVVVGGLVGLGPLVYVFLLWIFSVPVVLFEKKSLIDALRESARIVRFPMPGGMWHSHPMRLTGFLTLVGVVLLVALLPAGGPWALWWMRGFKAALEGDITPFFQIPGAVFVASSVLLLIPQVLLAAIFPGAVTAYYLDARARMWPDGGAALAPYLQTLCLGEGTKEGLPRPKAPPATPAPEPAPQALPPNWPDG